MDSVRHAALAKALTLAGKILAFVISPLFAIWLDYPVAMPRLDVIGVEKMLFTFMWAIFILGLYYRDKINSIHNRHFGKRA